MNHPLMTTHSHGMILLATVLATAFAMNGCGMLGEEDDTSSNTSNLFDDPTDACQDILLEAEQSDDPQAREAALIAYQACVDDGADAPLGMEHEACYDILEAVVRLRDDVDEALIHRLHDAYVACVFDYVQGQVGDGDHGPRPPRDPEHCEWLLAEADGRCQDDGQCRAEFERAFDECMHQEPPPPVDCREVAHHECAHLLDAPMPPEDPNRPPVDFERCLDDVTRACEAGQLPPGPEACLDEHLRRCDDLLADGPQDDPRFMEEFDRCVQEAHQICLPPPPDGCEQLLRDAEMICGLEGMAPDQDPARCWEDFQQAFEACQQNPPDPAEDCIRHAEERCGDLAVDPEHFERCIQDHMMACMGPPDPIQHCIEQRAHECEPMLAEPDPEGRGIEAFEACMDRIHHECAQQGPNDPAACEQLLRDADQICGPEGMAPDQDPARCWEDFHRAYQACIDGVQPPQPDACLEHAVQYCHELFAPDQLDPNDPAAPDRIEACIDEERRRCEGQPDPNDPAACEQILRDAEQVCQDDDVCWQEHHRAFEQCIGG